jgi:hypothetical protein
MREIKFRAWDKTNKWMERPFNLYECGCLNNEDGYSAEYFALMQYTGLKDKQGKEIYEGDIREGRWYSCTAPQEYRGVQVMKWNDLNACFEWDGHHIPEFIEVAVIGNIYENPELLGVK